MKIYGNIGSGLKLWKGFRRYNKEFKEIEILKKENKDKEAQNLIAYVLKDWVNNCISDLKMNVHIEGKENIPEGSIVLIGNHQGCADVPLLMKAMEDRQVSFIAKESLSKIPYLSKWIIGTGGIFIKRNNPREAIKVLNKGVELLKKGYSLVIFPEGTRSQSSKMNKFQSGSFKLATKAKVPIVPFSIDNTYSTYETKEVFQYDVDIYIKIHKPIETKNLTREEKLELPEKIEKIVRDGIFDLVKKQNKEI